MTSIVQDSTGYLWLAAGGSLTRFDGRSFATSSREDGLADTSVRAILPGGSGELWVGTDSGVFRRVDGGSTNLSGKHGLPSEEVRALHKDRSGRLWVGMARGAARLEQAGRITFKVVTGLESVPVNVIIEDRSGSVWFGSDLGLYRMSDGRLEDLNLTLGVANAPVAIVGLARDGGVWVTDSDRVWQVGGEGVWTVLPLELDGLRVTSIVEDEGRTVWVGTADGLFRFDGEHTTRVPGGPVAGVLSLKRDREGALWVGTQDGLSQYRGQEFVTYTTEDGLPLDELDQIFVDRNGDFWISSNAGVTRFDGNTFVTYDLPENLPSSSVEPVFEDSKGRIWIGTKSGPFFFDGRRFLPFPASDALKRAEIESIAEDRAGNVWFGTFDRGLFRFNGRGFTAFDSRNVLPHDKVECLLGDSKGNLWAGTDEGLCRFDGAEWRIFTDRDGLPDNEVESLLEGRDGALWVGTDGGVSRFDGETFQTWTARNGLVVDEVESIYEDRGGHLWFATENGLTRFNGEAFASLTQRDGLASNVVEGLVQDAEGAYWITTHGGLTRFRPNPGSTSTAAIRSVIADRHYRDASRVLAPEGGLVTFQFEGISFKTNPRNLLFRYRLVGLDDAWSTTRSRRVEYADLSSGQYVFEVQFIDRDLRWSNEATTVLHLEFSRAKQSLIVGGSIAFLVIVGLGIRTTRMHFQLRHAKRDLENRVMLRTRHLNDANEKLKNQIEARRAAETELETQRSLIFRADRLRSLGEMAAGIAHELNQPLVGVRGLAEHVLISLDRGWKVSDDKLRDRVGRIVEQADRMVHIIDHVRRFAREAGKPDSSSVTVNEVVSSGIGLVGAQLRSQDVVLKVDLAEDMPPVLANPFSLEEVLINLINNARDAVVNSSNGAEPRISVRTSFNAGEARPLGIEVEDNGSGIPPDVLSKIWDPFFTTKDPDKGTGLGLSISRAIIEDFGGVIQIDTEDGRGTTVTISLPAVGSHSLQSEAAG